jgi:hypothetical protein
MAGTAAGADPCVEEVVVAALAGVGAGTGAAAAVIAAGTATS